jgi:hypothetical protein
VTILQDPAFESWLERQLSHSASAMLSSISPVSIVKQRPGFGQTIRPIAGAIVASPVLGGYDPDPDYFFIGSAIPPSSSMRCACSTSTDASATKPCSICVTSSASALT